jgi:hypothetical protein
MEKQVGTLITIRTRQRDKIRVCFKSVKNQQGRIIILRKFCKYLKVCRYLVTERSGARAS